VSCPWFRGLHCRLPLSHLLHGLEPGLDQFGLCLVSQLGFLGLLQQELSLSLLNQLSFMSLLQQELILSLLNQLSLQSLLQQRAQSRAS
jgi:hypothetical protein